MDNLVKSKSRMKNSPVSAIGSVNEIGLSIVGLFCNEARKDFSKAERIDYARRLERIESLKAEKRMTTGKVPPMEKFPQGTTRDIVASKLGIGSGRQYEKEKYIVENQNALTPEDFVDWDEGKLSTNWEWWSKAYGKFTTSFRTR